MLSRVTCLLITLLWLPCWTCASPQDAVVRITSHGCSGTVIQTGPGKTLILTCAHAWEKHSDRDAPIVIDSPTPMKAPAVTVRPRVIKINPQDDLVLIEMNTGPLPYVCPVAPAPDYRPSTRPVGETTGSPRICTSVGYDEMRWPATVRRATIWSSVGNLTYTHERPWHGRSGGALIDEQGRLVGVVSGYEVDGQRRGMYASHTSILRFLGLSLPTNPPSWPEAGKGIGYRPSPNLVPYYQPSPPSTYELRSPRSIPPSPPPGMR